MTTLTHAEAPVPDEGAALRSVDPRTIADSPDNVRRPERDRIGLAGSIKELGILQPPTVREQDDGTLVLIAGERRKYSAIEAGLPLIDVYVRRDLSEARTVAGMLVENTQRDDLTVAEEAVAIQRLAGFEEVGGVKGIAKLTGRKQAEVKRALAVADSDVAMAVTERYAELTLEQAAVVAEFGADREAVKELTTAALKSPAQWSHVVSRLRQARKDAEAQTKLAAQLAEQGVPLYEAQWGYPSYPASLLSGLRIKPERHTECPGHAAMIVEQYDDDDHGIWVVEYVCTDAVEHGHIKARSGVGNDSSSASSESGGAMSDEQKAQRATVIANNRAWRAAEPVRREFVATLLARRTAPKATLRFLAESLLLDPGIATDSSDEQLATVQGKESACGDSWHRPNATVTLDGASADGRLAVVILARVAAGYEMQRAHVNAWRSPNRDLARWFGFLVACGYSLSEVEQLVTDGAAKEGGNDE